MAISQITAGSIADGTVVASDIADGTITDAKIVAVANTKITGLVTAAQIANVANTQVTGVMTTAQIADSAITTDKIAAGAVITADIADANVTDAKIVSVANTKITGVLTASQLANTAVTAGVYGGSSNSALITVDAQGRITSASNVAAGSGQIQTQVFTSPGTWTKPSTASQVRVLVIGGGGGGTWNSPGTSGGTSSFGPAVSATGGGAGGGDGSGTVNVGTTLFNTVSSITKGPYASLGMFVHGLHSASLSGSGSTYSVSSTYIAGAKGTVTPGVGTPGGYGGVVSAVVPVSAPVSITVGTGGTNPPNSSGDQGSRVPADGAGQGGVIVVEFVG
jgi:hypothetical protein